MGIYFSNNKVELLENKFFKSYKMLKNDYFCFKLGKVSILEHISSKKIVALKTIILNEKNNLEKEFKFWKNRLSIKKSKCFTIIRFFCLFNLKILSFSFFCFFIF